MAYLLFAGDDYYPEGGANDLIGRFDSVEEAVAAHDPKEYEDGWANILCLESLEIVKRYWRRHGWGKAPGIQLVEFPEAPTLEEVLAFANQGESE